MSGYTKPRPGDLCRLVREGDAVAFVEHWHCDEYPDGTVTDVRTGEVVSSR